MTSYSIFLSNQRSLFRRCKLREESSGLLERTEGASLFNCSTFKYEDLVALLNSTHSMSDNDHGTASLDIIEGLLDLFLGVFIQSWSCLIKKKNFRFSNDCSGNSNSLFLTSWELSTFNTTLSFNSLVKFIIFEASRSIVNVSWHILKRSLLLVLTNHFEDKFFLFVVLSLAHYHNKGFFVLLHNNQQRRWCIIKFGKLFTCNKIVTVGNSSCLKDLFIGSIQFTIEDIL